MNSMVLKQSERQFQTAVIDYAERLGWKVAHFHDSRREVRPGVYVGDKAAAGFPDLVLVRDGRLVFIELKTEKGRLGEPQKEWLNALMRVELLLSMEAAGEPRVQAYVFRPSDWPEIERVLAR